LFNICFSVKYCLSCILHLQKRSRI
jgi:hypothetical protein